MRRLGRRENQKSPRPKPGAMLGGFLPSVDRRPARRDKALCGLGCRLQDDHPGLILARAGPFHVRCDGELGVEPGERDRHDTGQHF